MFPLIKNYVEQKTKSKDELTLLCFLLFSSSSSGAQRSNQIKLFFNEQKDAQKTHMGIFVLLMGSGRESQQDKRREGG